MTALNMALLQLQLRFSWMKYNCFVGQNELLLSQLCRLKYNSEGRNQSIKKIIILNTAFKISRFNFPALLYWRHRMPVQFGCIKFYLIYNLFYCLLCSMLSRVLKIKCLKLAVKWFVNKNFNRCNRSTCYLFWFAQLDEGPPLGRSRHLYTSPVLHQGYSLTS